MFLPPDPARNLSSAHMTELLPFRWMLTVDGPLDRINAKARSKTEENQFLCCRLCKEENQEKTHDFWGSCRSTWGCSVGALKNSETREDWI